MICNQCGNDVSDSARFRPYCGVELRADADSSVEKDTVSVNGDFQEMSRDDLEIYWAEGMFPAIHLEIENGMAKRVWQSA